MRAKRALIGMHVLLLGILACNLQGVQANQPDLPATITAQALTLQAPTATPSSPTEPAVVEVQVSVTSETNCRTGPAQAFDLVSTAEPGQKFKVVGKNTPTGYWIIQDPAGGTCWLWGKYAVVTGDPSLVPEFPSPALPTPAFTKTPKPTKTPELPKTVPSAPSGLNGPRTCEGYMDGIIPRWREKVTFTWQDNSSDEQGFGVYQNDLLVSTLPKNSTSYQAEFTYAQGTGGQLFDKFAVEAYNIVGSSTRPAIDAPRCP